MCARLGETSRTTRWAFICDQRNFQLVVDACRKAYVPAAFSPLHDLDVWDRPDILNYAESICYQRDGVLFYYDERFDVKDGFTLKDVMQRPETPFYAVWRGGNVTTSDRAAAADPDNGDYIVSDDWPECVAKVLPIPGEQKKPHHHCQVHLDVSITRDAFLEKIRLDKKSVYYWEPVGNPAGLLRYYAHMDNPEKAQYRKSDVLSVNGFDLSPLYRKTEASKVADFEYLYAVVRSCPAKYANLVTVCDALVGAGHPEIAYALRSGSGFWKEIIYQQSKGALQRETVPDLKRGDLVHATREEEEAYRKSTDFKKKFNEALDITEQKQLDDWKEQLAQVMNSFL